MAIGPPVYEDLRIRIEGEGGGPYKVRVEHPNGAVAMGEFIAPIGELELENFVLRVGLPRRRVRAYSSSQMEEARRFGSRLFGALMRDQVGQAFADARAGAEARGSGLRLTLMLGDAPALMRLPWEFLFERPVFLSQSLHTPVVRGLDLRRLRPAVSVSSPLRVLGIASSPAGSVELDVTGEQEKLARALSGLAAGVVEVEWLPRATLGALERALATADPFHILHYVGHGRYDERSSLGSLQLEDEHGRSRPATGSDLCALLSDSRSLQLVVLNACEGARTSVTDPFAGVATTLLECGIPAVVGMQFEITDEAALTFSERLYSALARATPIDAAVVETRKAIFAAGYDTEFGTPVLYVAPGRTQLFELATPLPQSDVPVVQVGVKQADVRLTPHLDIGVPIGREVRPQVHVERTGTATQALEVAVVLLVSEHFAVVGGDMQRLVVPAGKRRSDAVSFTLRVLDSVDTGSEPMVVAVLLHEGRPVGRVENKVALGGAAGPVLEIDVSAVSPDFTVQVVEESPGRWQCLVSSPLLPELALPQKTAWDTPASLRALVERVFETVIDPALSEQERHRALVGAGKELFSASPDSFQEALWMLVDSEVPLRSILVVAEDDAGLPWEILVPHRGPDTRDALGADYAIGRWPEHAVPSQHLKLGSALVIAPVYRRARQLAAADEEAARVSSVLEGRRLEPANVASLETALATRGADVIHFVGHAEQDRLLLEGDEVLSAWGLAALPHLAEALRRDRPLVFLNASRVAAGPGAPPVVRSLIRMGASAVIAPQWAVEDAVATAAAAEFYEALRADPQRPLADIVRSIRSHAYRGHAPKDSYASYVFFGDPLAARAP